MKNKIEQLVKIYEKETFSGDSLSNHEIEEYFRVLIEKGNIITKEKEGKIVAYIEYWFITPQQLKKKITKTRFNIALEDISKGNLCYINTIWIDSDYRGNGTIRYFKDKIIDKKQFIYWVGHEHNNRARLRMWRC